MGNLIDFVIAGGVEYVVTLGTTGETPTLDKQEKLSIVNYTFEKVNGRVPVVVGIVVTTPGLLLMTWSNFRSIKQQPF